MTDLDTYSQAHTELDLWSNVTAHGANPAGDLTMRSIIALRDVLVRHQPVDIGSNIRCAGCDHVWANCPDARSVLAVLGLPDKE